MQLRDEPPNALALTSLTLVIWTVENFFLPGSRGIWVAFLSRLPFTASQQLQAFPPLLRPVQVRNSSFDDPATPSDEALSAEMIRGGLELTMSLDGTALTLINAHFKT